MELQDKLNACGEHSYMHAPPHSAPARQPAYCKSSLLIAPLMCVTMFGLPHALGRMMPCPADRAGGTNAALPRDEDRDSFAAIVASCGQRGEAEDLLANIIGAA